MQHFDWSSFAALSPAKAKAAALQLFEAATLAPDADWRGVSYALHAVISRKPGKVARADDMADGFTPWADYEPGKGAARGMVTVTFADGWSRTVGIVAGKSIKGLKPWSIGPAIRFAITCWRLATARRVTGNDGWLYHTVEGRDIALDGILACPEIVSVISADGQGTTDGDLTWNPDDANAFTRDKRAGLFVVPELYGPHSKDVKAQMIEARGKVMESMGLGLTKAERDIAERSKRAQDRGMVDYSGTRHDTYISEVCVFERAIRLLDAVEAFESVSDTPEATGRVVRPFDFIMRMIDVCAMLDAVSVTPDGALASRLDELHAVFGMPIDECPPAPSPEPARAMLTVTSNPAPLALAPPPVLLALPAPGPHNRPVKPRYRVTASGNFERIAA